MLSKRARHLLTKKEKKRLVNIAWEQVREFIKAWQESPYEWNTERDVQVEIASRIIRKYKSINKHRFFAKYKHWIARGYEKGQEYNRVWCEPPVYYEEKKNGKRHCCRPDIVVFDDLNNPDLPNDINEKGNKTRINCPILWVCEIKYQPEWANKRPDKRGNWDLDKIRFLRRQVDGTKYACWLNISRERARHGTGLHKVLFDDGSIRKYNITLPKD